MRRKLFIAAGFFVLVVGAAVLSHLAGLFEDSVAPLETQLHPLDGKPAPGVDMSSATMGSERSSVPVGSSASRAILSGTVSDLAGEPLAGASVLVRSTNDLPSLAADALLLALRERAVGRRRIDLPRVIAETSTDEGGRYSFAVADWPGGQYTVLAAAQGKAPRGERWEWTPDPERLDFYLPDGESISGVVRGPDGRPVPGADVSTFEEQGDWDPAVRSGILVARTATDDRGRFLLDVGGGLYTVTAAADGFAEGEVRHVPSDSEVVVDLESGRTVAGIVRNREGEAVGDAGVTLYRNRRSSPKTAKGWLPRNELQRRMYSAALKRVTTDERGEFRFADLGTGRYVVVVEKSGFRTAERSLVVLEDVSTVEIDVVLRASGVLKGQVRNEEGSEVAGALVVLGRDRRLSERQASRRSAALEAREQALREEGHLEELDSFQQRTAAIRQYEVKRHEQASRQPLPLSRAVAATETDRAGRFRIDTVGNGAYVLSIQATDYTAYRQDGIRLDEGETDLDIVLDGGVRIEGRVISEASGDVIPAATIILRRSVEGAGRLEAEVKRVRANDAGEYAVGGLVPGDRWQIDARAEGYGQTAPKILEIGALDTVQRIDLPLHVAAAVSGRVVDVAGQPLDRVRVTWQTASSAVLDRIAVLRGRGGDAKHVGTSDEGLFTLEGLPPEQSIRLAFSRHDYEEYLSEPFIVRAGERFEGMEVEMERGGRLLVAVTQPTGEAVEGARVRLWKTVSEPVGADRGAPNPWPRLPESLGIPPRRTDSAGEAHFSGLDGGPYLLTATARGFQPFADTIRVTEDNDLQYPIRLFQENVLTGVVVDTSGTPVPDVELRATARNLDLPPERRHRSNDESDEGGRFTLGSLGPGPYDLVVEHRGFAKLGLESVGVNQDIRLELQRLASISGRILAEETSRPISRFEIRAQRGESSARRSSAPEIGRSRERGGSDYGRFSSSEGAFRLDGLTPGECVLEVRARGFVTKKIALHLEEGRELEALEVRMPRGE